MGFNESKMTFSNQQALTDAADTISSNVYDAGAAKNLFQGSVNKTMLIVQITTDDIATTPTFRARFVGADDAALTTNPVIIADTGTTAEMAAGDIPWTKELPLAGQTADKRYYGVIYNLGNNDNDIIVNAYVAEHAQIHMNR
jgi:hypothetical protein